MTERSPGTDLGILPRQRRFDLHGYPLSEVIHVTECADCGMGLVSAREYHPYRACAIFKRTHDSNRVWESLLPVIEGMQRDR